MNDRRDQPPVLLLNPTDPLVVATRDLAVGEAVGQGEITPSEPIGRGHKLAIKPIESGAPVRKLGHSTAPRQSMAPFQCAGPSFG